MMLNEVETSGFVMIREQNVYYSFPEMGNAVHPLAINDAKDMLTLLNITSTNDIKIALMKVTEEGCMPLNDSSKLAGSVCDVCGIFFQSSHSIFNRDRHK